MMKNLLIFVIKNYLIPVIMVLVIVVIVASRKYNITETDLESAYAEELNSYSWIQKVDTVQGYIFGSSSLRYGVSSKLLDDSNGHWLNLSKDARDPIVFYLLLQKYYNFKKPKKIVVGLDPWIFTKGYYYHRMQLMYLDLDAQETFRMHKKDPSVYFTKFKQIAGTYIHFNTLSKAFVNNEIPENYGSIVLNKGASNFQEINESWFEAKRYHWSDMQFEYLKKIKDYCVTKKIELIFIIPPKRTDYNTAIKKLFTEEHQQWWQKINQCIGGEKIVGRFSDLSSYPQNSIFAESCHLNGNGQKVYTELLKEQLKHPEIIEPGYDFY